MSFTIVNQSVKVRLVADLSAAAFKSKQDKELALWHCLRALKPYGGDYISIDAAIDGLTGIFNYSRRTAFRILNQGEGLFWHRFETKRGSVIKIYGIKPVSLMLDTPLNNDLHYREVPAEKFNSPKLRCLALWQSIYKPHGMKANPISRQSIETYTGTQKRTQIRRDKAAKVKRVSNRIAPDDGQQQKRLPNIYHSEYEPGPKGQLRKVRRFLKAFRNDEELEKKRYFSSTRAILKNKHHDDICFVPVRSTKRQILGRMEWKPVITLVM